VRLAYRWLRPDGTPAVAEGERTELPLPVAPGAEAAVEMGVRAPREPGSYRLVIDPVFEHVAWFSDRGAAPFEAVVEVTAAGEGEPEAGRGESGTEAGPDGVSEDRSGGLAEAGWDERGLDAEDRLALEQPEAGWHGDGRTTREGSLYLAGNLERFRPSSASDHAGAGPPPAASLPSSSRPNR
jgi:hypothetical protein